MSKIITPTSNQSAPEAPSAEPALLSQQTFVELAGAVARQREIESLTLLTPTTEAELRGLKEFIATTLVKHVDEFLGTWHTVRNEYQPMLRAISMVATRVNGVLSTTKQIQQQAQAKPADEQAK